MKLKHLAMLVLALAVVFGVLHLVGCASKDMKRMLAAEALWKNAQTRLRRTQELARRNAASAEELDERLSAATSAENTYRERKSAYELAVSGLWEKQIAQATAEVAVDPGDRLRIETPGGGGFGRPPVHRG